MVAFSNQKWIKAATGEKYGKPRRHKQKYNVNCNTFCNSSNLTDTFIHANKNFCNVARQLLLFVFEIQILTPIHDKLNHIT